MRYPNLRTYTNNLYLETNHPHVSNNLTTSILATFSISYIRTLQYETKNHINKHSYILLNCLSFYLLFMVQRESQGDECRFQGLCVVFVSTHWLLLVLASVGTGSCWYWVLLALDPVCTGSCWHWLLSALGPCVT